MTNKIHLKPPDGGYGYLIALSMVLLFFSTFIPCTCFGLVFGPFLAQRGDETSSVATASSIFNAVFHFAGLITNPLLHRWSQRTIGLIGAFMVFTSNILTIFVQTAEHLYITFGLLHGLGVGFLVSAIMTAFNDYFAEKKSFMLSVVHTANVAITILYPTFSKYLLNEFGFRGTVAIIAALSAHTIFASTALQPVKWHMKKVVESPTENRNEKNYDHKFSLVENNQTKLEENDHLLVNNIQTENRRNKARPSVISLGSIGVPVEMKNSKDGFWKSIINSLDYSLLKDPFYNNLVIGVSIPLLSEFNFIAILPAYLSSQHGYTKEEIAMTMTVYFAADLGFRLCFTLFVAFVAISNRTVYLANSILLVLLRIGFSFSPNYLWTLIASGLLGANRGLIHIPLVLAIAEEYPDNFSSAFTLYMVLCGVVAFFIGPLLSTVKYYTHSDQMVMHFLTLIVVLMVTSWFLEIIYKKFKGIKKDSSAKPVNIAH